MAIEGANSNDLESAATAHSHASSGETGCQMLALSQTQSEGPDTTNIVTVKNKREDLQLNSQSTSLFEKKKSEVLKAVPFFKLFSYADSLDMLLMALGTFGALAHGIIVPINMVLFGRLVTELGSHSTAHSKALSQVPFMLFIVALNTAWVTWLEVACWVYTGERQAARIRTKFLEALLNQDISYYDTEASTGDVVSRFAQDTLLVHDALGEKVANLLHHVGTFVGGIAIGLIYTWQLALLTFLWIPLLAVAAGFCNKMYTNFTIQGQACNTKAMSIVDEAITQVRTVYAFVRELKELASFSEALEVAKRFGMKAALSRGLGLGLSLGIVNCSWALQLWYGSILVSRNSTNGGKILTTVFSVVFSGMALGKIMPALQVFTQGRVAAYHIFSLIERKCKINSASTEGGVIQDIKGVIEFDAVYFRYPSRLDIPVLSNLSFTIQAGNTVALVGRSGSGKSTVLSLIERFYDPSAGVILLDGQDIKSLQVKWLRSQISMVGQEPALFATSIKENILYGKDGASDEEVKRAAEDAEAHSFIASLPKHYDTQVGERGVQLSGGQKQRVAIARAVLKRPRILLLDEATSALDAESEECVQRALERLMKNHTTVIVAHRLSTVKHADAIAVFSSGQIVEMGTHHTLLQDRSGAYSTLVQLQQLSDNDHVKGIHDQREEHYQVGSTMPSDQSIPPTMPEDNVRKSAQNNQLNSYTQGGVKETNPTSPSYLRTITSGIKHFSRLAAPTWFYLSIGSLGAALTGAVNPLFALVLIEVVSLYFEDDLRKMRHTINKWSLSIACLGVASIVTNAAQYYFFGRVGETVTKRLQEDTLEAIMKNEIGWFDREENASSTITSRLAYAITSIKNAICDRASLLFQYGVSICLALSVGMTIEWRMAVITIATFPVTMIGSSMKQTFLARGFAGDLQKIHERTSHVAGEAVTNIRTVASLCAEEKINHAFKQELHKPLQTSFQRAIKGGLMFGASQSALHMSYALGLWYVTVLVRSGDVKYSDALKVFQVVAWTGFVLSEALIVFPDVAKGLESMTSLFNIIHRKTEIEPDQQNSEILHELEGHIEFEKVTFKYPSRPDVTVLDALSLVVEARTTVALVGSSGSGKSSIISLIERFYDPTSGRVLLSGRDLRSLNLHCIRNNIGLVQQEPALFGGTIKENILYGNEKASESELIRAAQLANMHEFISNLPHGYETKVGDRGVQLSGGQKQRIAIARVILKDPPILLMDEATSALDAESERLVQTNLDEFMQGTRTTIMIAHRLATIPQAAKIVVLQNGSIAEEGSHDQLMSRKGSYAQMVHLQNFARE